MFGRRGGWGSGQLGAAIEFFRIFWHVRFSVFFFFFSQIAALGTRRLFKSDKISPSAFNKTAVEAVFVVTTRKTS